MVGNEEIEHQIRAILQKHCNYGWGHHYILDSQFNGLIQELVALLRPGSEVPDQELVGFLLQARKFLSEQEKAEMMKREFIVLKRQKG
jgi:hypothetical protein